MKCTANHTQNNVFAVMHIIEPFNGQFFKEPFVFQCEKTKLVVFSLLCHRSPNIIVLVYGNPIYIINGPKNMRQIFSYLFWSSRFDFQSSGHIIACLKRDGTVSSQLLVSTFCYYFEQIVDDVYLFILNFFILCFNYSFSYKYYN